jgi:hypothetical protein
MSTVGSGCVKTREKSAFQNGRYAILRGTWGNPAHEISSFGVLHRLDRMQPVIANDPARRP